MWIGEIVLWENFGYPKTKFTEAERKQVHLRPDAGANVNVNINIKLLHLT